MPNLKSYSNVIQWNNTFNDFSYKSEETKIKDEIYKVLKELDLYIGLDSESTDYIKDQINKTISNYMKEHHTNTWSKPKAAPQKEVPTNFKANIISMDENKMIPAVIKVTSVYANGEEKDLGNIKFDISEEKKFMDIIEEKRLELERIKERKRFEAQEDKALNKFLKSVAIATTALTVEDYFYKTKSCKSTLVELADKGMLDKFIGYMKNMGIEIPEQEKAKYLTILKNSTPSLENNYEIIDNIEAKDMNYIPYEQRENMSEMINEMITPVNNIEKFKNEISNIAMNYIKNSHEVSIDKLMTGLENELETECQKTTENSTIKVKLNMADQYAIESYDIYVANEEDKLVTSEVMDNNGMLLVETYKSLNNAYIEAVNRFQHNIDDKIIELTENSNLSQTEIEEALTEMFQEETNDFSVKVTIEPTYLGYSYEIKSIEERYAEENMYFRGNFSSEASDRMIEVLEREDREEEEIDELY